MLSSEPTRIVGYSTSAVAAIIALLVAFGADISDDQKNAVLTAIGTCVPIVIFMVEVTRSRVVSPKSAGEAVGLAQQNASTSTTVPLVDVGGYKDAVADTMNADVADLKFKPKVDNAGG